MLRLLTLALLGILAASPLAAAQNDSTGELPVGTGTPDADESVEGPPGIVYGLLVLAGTAAFTIALAWVVHRQKRRLP